MLSIVFIICKKLKRDNCRFKDVSSLDEIRLADGPFQLHCDMIQNRGDAGRSR